MWSPTCGCTTACRRREAPSEVEDEARGAGAGDADHHAVVGFSLVLVEDGVAVVGNPFQDWCLARAAGAFGAGGKHSDPGVLDDGQDGLVRRDGEGELALREVDLEGIGKHGFGEGFGDKALDVQGALRPAAAALFDRGQQGSGPQQ